MGEKIPDAAIMEMLTFYNITISVKMEYSNKKLTR